MDPKATQNDAKAAGMTPGEHADLLARRKMLQVLAWVPPAIAVTATVSARAAAASGPAPPCGGRGNPPC